MFYGIDPSADGYGLNPSASYGIDPASNLGFTSAVGFSWLADTPIWSWGDELITAANSATPTTIYPDGQIAQTTGLSESLQSLLTGISRASQSVATAYRTATQQTPGAGRLAIAGLNIGTLAVLVVGGVLIYKAVK